MRRLILALSGACLFASAAACAQAAPAPLRFSYASLAKPAGAARRP